MSDTWCVQQPSPSIFALMNICLSKLLGLLHTMHTCHRQWQQQVSSILSNVPVAMYGCTACRLLNSCRGSQNLESLARRCHNLQLSLKKRSSRASPIRDHHRLQAIIRMHLALCQLDTDCSNCTKTKSKREPLRFWARPIEDLRSTLHVY